MPEKIDMSKSSNLKEATYDSEKKILIIKFHRDDRVYGYLNVPPHVWRNFKDAHGSYGRFFYWNIRGKYPYTEVNV